MRVYFLSYINAALKLNGIYLGMVDGFERHIELDPNDKVFAELLPANNLQPLNFFLDESFFRQPPPFVDLYLLDGDALVYIRDYGVKNTRLNIVFQTRFCGNLITIFSQGGVYASIEGAEYSLTPLPLDFINITAEGQKLSGRDALALYSGDELLIISDTGKIIFLNRVESAEFGDTLKVRVAFETCAEVKAECAYSYDGEKLNLISSRTFETRPPEKNILHFAFFESVLTRCDCAKYLSDELKPRAGELKSYLGNFVSVTVPPEKFYILHGNIPAAGLVYPKSKNLFEVKYFTVTLVDDKIDNIYEV